MRFSKSLIILALSAGLAACGDSDKSSDNMDEALEEMTMEMGEMATNHQFMVEVVNLTAARILPCCCDCSHRRHALENWRASI